MRVASLRFASLMVSRDDKEPVLESKDSYFPKDRIHASSLADGGLVFPQNALERGSKFSDSDFV